MKLVIAVIQPTKLSAVREALEKIEVTRLTVCDAQGFGRQRGRTEMFRGHEYTTTLLRKVVLEIVVNDDFLERTLDTIVTTARTGIEGTIGDKRAKWLGERLRAATCELFEHWADYRQGRISRAALLRRMGPVRRKVERLLLRGMQSGSKEVRGTCRELYEHRQWLWTFLRHEGVEPTNNAGERALRHAVIWRKLSFGTQSAAGSRFVETMLTVIETCRQQRRNAFAFVTTAVEAHLAHQPAPSLLPGV